MCRRTVLGPLHGSGVRQLVALDSPERGDTDTQSLVAFVTDDMLGVAQLPLDGNPYRYTCRRAHPRGIARLACADAMTRERYRSTADDDATTTTRTQVQFLFTAGGDESCVHMWRVDRAVVGRMVESGGEALEPFYSALPGGEWVGRRSRRVEGAGVVDSKDVLKSCKGDL